MVGRFDDVKEGGLYGRKDRRSFVAKTDTKNAAGVDHVTIEQFATRLPENLEHLQTSLRAGTYVPQAVRRVWIPKPGTNQQRPLGIPSVRDRVAQAALRRALEPIFERDFAKQSYGFRPGRDCQDALARVDELLKAAWESRSSRWTSRPECPAAMRGPTCRC
jgi:retron-type reverse transcriptase